MQPEVGEAEPLAVSAGKMAARLGSFAQVMANLEALSAPRHPPFSSVALLYFARLGCLGREAPGETRECRLGLV